MKFPSLEKGGPVDVLGEFVEVDLPQDMNAGLHGLWGGIGMPVECEGIGPGLPQFEEGFGLSPVEVSLTQVIVFGFEVGLVGVALLWA